MSKEVSLLKAAREAAQKAQCPYSNFHVGAAVRCKDGTMVSGCNVENASYGLTDLRRTIGTLQLYSPGPATA